MFQQLGPGSWAAAAFPATLGRPTSTTGQTMEQDKTLRQTEGANGHYVALVQTQLTHT